LATTENYTAEGGKANSASNTTLSAHRKYSDQGCLLQGYTALHTERNRVGHGRGYVVDGGGKEMIGSRKGIRHITAVLPDMRLAEPSPRVLQHRGAFLFLLEGITARIFTEYKSRN